jgi:hypothetical protein
LADGGGGTQVGGIHLDSGATIPNPSTSHATTLLVVHGRITVTRLENREYHITLSAGMGAVFARIEGATLPSDALPEGARTQP